MGVASFLQLYWTSPTVFSSPNSWLVSTTWRPLVASLAFPLKLACHMHSEMLSRTLPHSLPMSPSPSRRLRRSRNSWMIRARTLQPTPLPQLQAEVAAVAVQHQLPQRKWRLKRRKKIWTLIFSADSSCAQILQELESLPVLASDNTK